MAYELTISDPEGGLEASFVPELGMIGTSLRHQGEELLHQGRGLAAYAQSGSTFGIPLLYPWANRVSAWEFELGGEQITLDPDARIIRRDEPTGTAIHGLLAASPHWTVADADSDTLTAELDFGAVPEYMAVFPFAQRLRYTASVRESALTISLTVTAGPERAVPISFGFHPYLTLPGSDRRSWELQIPVERQAVVDERLIPTGEGIEIAPEQLDGPLGDRTFDTGYDRVRGVDAGGNVGAPPVFSVADAHHRISLIHTAGYPVSQVYTPEAADFICFEPMTAPTNALISGDRLRWLGPGSEFTAVFTVAVA